MEKVETININEKVEELVNYLYEKGMSQDGYLRVANWQEAHKSYNVLEFCQKTYNIFEYIGMNEEQIERFIVKNLNIFLKPIEEVYKLAFVLKEVGAIDEIFESDYFSGKVTNYKRLFMRDFISKKSGKYERGNGIAPLLVGDKAAYDRYKMHIAAFHAFGTSVDSDVELENALNKILRLNGNDITVDEYLERSAKLFYTKYLRENKFGKGSKK